MSSISQPITHSPVGDRFSAATVDIGKPSDGKKIDRTCSEIAAGQ